MPVVRESHGSRGIQSRGLDRVLQAPIGKLDNVADGPIHGQDAPSKFSIGSTPAILDLDWMGPS